MPVQVTVPDTAMSTVLGENGNPGDALADKGNGLVTVIVWNDDAVTIPRVAEAVIFVAPVATAVTRPVDGATVAIPVALDVQVTVAPAIGEPLWSRGDAVSCSVDPTATDDAGPEMTTDVSTGAGGSADTVIVRFPCTVTPPAVACAVITAAPAEMADTRPDAETVATAVAPLDQATVATIGAPSWSTADAVSCDVWPTAIAVAPESDTVVSTGSGTTVKAIVEFTVIAPELAATDMVAVPGLTAATKPADDTDATAGAELVHTIVAPMAAYNLAR